MKGARKRRGICSVCLVACLLWSILGSSAAAGGTGKISLEGASVILQKPTVTYTGQSQEPEVVVLLNGNFLMPDAHYTVSYANNVNAGTATVTVTGIGDYTGSTTTTFEILPVELRKENISVISCVKGYDGSCEANPKFKVSLPYPNDKVEVICGSAVYDNQYVGKQKTVTLTDVKLAGPDGNNYVLEEGTSAQPWTIQGEITEQVPSVKTNVEIAKGLTRDLLDYIPEPWKDRTTFSIDANQEEKVASMGCRLTGTSLTVGETPGSFMVYAEMKEKDLNADGVAEYSDETYSITVSVVEKESQPPVDGGEQDPQNPEEQQPLQEQAGFTLSGPHTVTYGQSIRMTATGGAGSGTVSYWVEPRGQRGQAVIDQQGLLTATQTGTVLVYAKKAGDDRYKEAKANPIEVTIQQASLIITVRDRTVTVGDALPVFHAKDYVVSGLVAGDVLALEPTLICSPAPDLSQPGRTAIQAMGAQVPVGGNYNSQISYVPGTLIIQARPTYAITVLEADLGTVTASHPQALPGTEITLTASPDQDCGLKKLTVQGASGKVPLWEAGEGRYTFVMPEEAVTVTAVFLREEPEPEPDPEPLPFLDVQLRDWYYEDVDYVYRLGLMQGTGATAFSPDGVTTRGMVVTILYRMEGSPQGAGWAPFSDVDPDAYYGIPVGWAAWYGIVNGYSAVSFGPNDQITREQLAAILYRYGEYKGWDLSAAGSVSQFTDWNDSHTYARPALTWAVGAGLLQGKGQGRLDPLGQASRAQVAAMLHRFHACYLAESEQMGGVPF